MNKIDNIQWPVTINKLAELLGTSRVRIQQIIKDLDKEIVEGFDFNWASKKGSPQFRVLFEPGAIKIAERLPIESAANFLDSKGIRRKQKITSESHYIGIIIEAIRDFTPFRKPFPVGPYRIDLYLPSIKLAIECDERGHKSYNALDHEDRQAYIERRLSCQFLRFDPYETNFNVGAVINKIFRKIIGVAAILPDGDPI